MKGNFEKKIIRWAVLIAIIPITISYMIFLYDKLNTIDQRIKTNLYNTAFTISQTPSVQEELTKRENVSDIQEHVMKFINRIQDVDIIVVADMTGKKYSHIDTKQIGENFVGEDKAKVLEKGEGYYSLTKGSMGTTLRRFEPIFYKDKQVGFVMVGKYYKDKKLLDYETQIMYLMLFILVFIITVILSKYLAREIKKSILHMEPEEIARLYNEKKAIINSISDGIVALNEEKQVVEVNKNCYMLFEGLSIDKVIEKLKPYLEENKSFEMREMMIEGKKVFVTLNQIVEKDKYLGAVITFMDKSGINKIAKEITGVDEIIKNLRANVHEFKNKLHVILGLINIKKYDEAKKYIMQIQEVQQNTSLQYSTIEDSYLRAMLISREIMAGEKKISFTLAQDSQLYKEHGCIASEDLIIILGNLIENSFEACVAKLGKEKKVEIFLLEDDKKIEIEVCDNGISIPKHIKNNMFERGVSSKTENGGTGLYLVKSKSELYYGDIEVKENDDEKNFRVTLFKGDNR